MKEEDKVNPFLVSPKAQLNIFNPEKLAKTALKESTKLFNEFKEMDTFKDLEFEEFSHLITRTLTDLAFVCGSYASAMNDNIGLSYLFSNIPRGGLIQRRALDKVMKEDSVNKNSDEYKALRNRMLSYAGTFAPLTIVYSKVLFEITIQKSLGKLYWRSSLHGITSLYKENYNLVIKP